MSRSVPVSMRISQRAKASQNVKKRARQYKGPRRAKISRSVPVSIMNQGEPKCQEACPSIIMRASQRAKASQNAKKRVRQYTCQPWANARKWTKSAPVKMRASQWANASQKQKVCQSVGPSICDVSNQWAKQRAHRCVCRSTCIFSPCDVYECLTQKSWES